MKLQDPEFNEIPLDKLDLNRQCHWCGERGFEWITCVGCHGHEDRKDFQICSSCKQEW